MRKLRRFINFKRKLKKFFKFSESNMRTKFVNLELLRSSVEISENIYEFKERGFRRGVRTDFLHNGSFHEAIGPVLVLAQFFGLMPVCGISAKSAKGLSFQWKSFRTWYAFVYVLMTVADSVFAIMMVFRGKLDMRNIEPIIFHVSILLGSAKFLQLAAKWPDLMRKWEYVEMQLPPQRTFLEREELAQRIKSVTFVMMMLSLTEHVLSTISAIHFANYCPSRPDPIESYFNNVSDHIFAFIEFNQWLGILGKLENILMTFGWSYMDVFVMNIGIGLSVLFKRIKRSIEAVKDQPMPESYWVQTRMQYRKICDLIEEVDVAISTITLISFANNLYFVCIQCLKSLNKMPSVAHAVYFYFSLLFLLTRTLAVSLFMAEVHDRSREPLQLMKFVPRETYCIEVERFANEISTDIVAMTGHKYFNITRKLVLTIAGTIATYELVLIQFHVDQKLWHCGTD